MDHMREKHGIQLHNKSRFTLAKLFEKEIKKRRPNQNSVEELSLVEFRQLTQIEDLDEKQESLHCIRQILTKHMLDPATGLQELARVARSSSTRAYAGHNAEFRHIFDLRNLNLTEYARSFGIYKVVHETMSRNKHQRPASESNDKKASGEIGKKRTAADADITNLAAVPQQPPAIDVNEGQASEMFTRRLQKSKIKDLERELREVQQSGGSFADVSKIKGKLAATRKEVFTDERKLDQRRQGFERAKNNLKATALSEFM